MNHPVLVTLVLLAGLGAIFLKGFREAVGLAVPIVGVYLLLNVSLIAHELMLVWQQPAPFDGWYTRGHARARRRGHHGGRGASAFSRNSRWGCQDSRPASPSCRSSAAIRDDTERNPRGRIRNTKKLLTAAALIMSVLLVGSSIVTTVLVPPEAFRRRRPGLRPRARLPRARASWARRSARSTT